MITELISVGTEILLGNIVNTNSAYLSEKCAQLGLSVYYQTVVGDNEARMRETIQTALDELYAKEYVIRLDGSTYAVNKLKLFQMKLI